MFKQKSKEDKFYRLFLESAKNVNEAAVILRTNLDSLINKETDVKKTEELEEKGDKLLRKAVKELNEAFITPIDREDVYSIIKGMDDVLDLINSSMHRFIMFNISESTEESKALGDYLVQITKELVDLMDELKKKGCKSKQIAQKIADVRKTERKTDKVFRKSVADLFENETDVLTVIKWKEIYQLMENTIDNCQRIAVMVEEVVIKNA